MSEENRFFEQLKKRKRRRIAVSVCVILILAVIAAGAFSGALRGRGSDEGGSAALSGGTKPAGTVTVEIRYDGLAAHPELLKAPGMRDFVNENGVMLERTEFTFSEGQTVLDALDGVLRANDIRYETKSSGVTSVYVKGIGDLYEKDAGNRSGWVYIVNGRSADESASVYELSDGDEILWYYTYDYNEDVG